MVTTTKELAKPIKNILAGNSFARKSLVVSLCFAASLLFTPYGEAGQARQKIVPGVYEFLMLAVNRDGEVSGFYRESQGEGVVKTCSFFLKGKDVDGQASIVTWNERVFPGILRNVGNDDVNLKIPQGLEHPGCGLVLMPQIADEGRIISRISETKWESLKVVNNQRAALYSEPSIHKKTKSYFIKNDVLGVMSVSGQWAKVEFPREGKASIAGWVMIDDIKDPTPPKN